MTFFCRLIGQPSTWLLSQLFQLASKDSIHGKLYRKNMDGLNSFYDTDDGLHHLVSNESTAMIVDTPIHSFEDYHCKVIKHTKTVVFIFKQVPFSLVK